jgi:hypothetical protein
VGKVCGISHECSYCVPHKDCDENGLDPAAVKVVADKQDVLSDYLASGSTTVKLRATRQFTNQRR